MVRMTVRDASKAGLHLRELRQGLAGGRSGKALNAAADDIGKQALQIVREETQNAYPGGSGKLRRSWRVKKSTARGKVISVSVVSSVPYARIRDRGGVIRPKRRSFLTVPIHGSAVGRRARSFSPTFVRNNTIFLRVSRERATPLYALKKQVTVRGSGYLEKAARRLRRYITVRTGKAIRDLSGGVRRG